MTLCANRGLAGVRGRSLAFAIWDLFRQDFLVGFLLTRDAPYDQQTKAGTLGEYMRW
jgi:hypothetical protein